MVYWFKTKHSFNWKIKYCFTQLKKGTFEFNFAPVTCYLLPENFHLSNTMQRPSEDKKFLNKSFNTVDRTYHTITVKYKKAGQTFCISFPSSMSENGIRLNGILQT